MGRRSKKRVGRVTAIIFIAFFALMAGTAPYARLLEKRYYGLLSPIVTDRNGTLIEITKTPRDTFSRPLNELPPTLKELLIRKEDRFFYWHPGINPFSVLRDLAGLPFSRTLRGSSTLTQQLVKVLLGNESHRTIRNKLVETWYAIALELHLSKEQILTMYANTAYFGNQAQGVEEASYYYFGAPAASLTQVQALKLLTALNAPSARFPGTDRNTAMAARLASLFDIPVDEAALEEKWVLAREERTHATVFELNSLAPPCRESCALSVDSELSENLREILRRNIASPAFETVKNGAIVVILLPSTELLAVVGSPNPASSGDGAKINMAIQPRAIGSTAKPFIYAKAFEKGARPYSLVDDREYKYEIAAGFPFYPKNFDGAYRGMVTLHEALSNSLNVPSVKTLEFVGVQSFSEFLSRDLGFMPLQPLEEYGLGIALGSLEMDLMTLSHYFTVFPNEGVLHPLTLFRNSASPYITPPMEAPIASEQRVFSRPFTQLINKILSDRETSVGQFGMKSNLNLPAKNYALKTGTSRDFHDSWTIGYTPDFLVGVWLGNSDNSPMRQITGQIGAGKIWHEAMEVVLASAYNKKTPFSYEDIQEFSISGTLEYGFPGDAYDVSRGILLENRLLLLPHDADTYLFGSTTAVPFKASGRVRWSVDGIFAGEGEALSWRPPSPGTYMIKA